MANVFECCMYSLLLICLCFPYTTALLKVSRRLNTSLYAELNIKGIKQKVFR